MWEGDKLVHRCAVPREASRLSEQKAWFVECLPDHVLLIKEGGFWEVVVHRPATRRGRAPDGHAGPDRWPRRLASRRLPGFRSILWGSGLPVAWIEETGRRLTDIAERALVLRWSRGGSLRHGTIDPVWPLWPAGDTSESGSPGLRRTG